MDHSRGQACGKVRCATWPVGCAAPFSMGVVWLNDHIGRGLGPVPPSFGALVAVTWCPCRRHFAPLSPSFGAPLKMVRCARRRNCVRVQTTWTHFDDFRASFGSLVAVIWRSFRRHFVPLSPSFGALSAVTSCPCRRHFGPLSPSFGLRAGVAWAPSGSFPHPLSKMAQRTSRPSGAAHLPRPR